MENNHKLALFVSYYLSRFNLEAYANLGYNTMKKAHEAIGKQLNVNPHTVKNMRDEFDPLFGHRAGWYQRPMSPSRTNVALSLESLDEPEIRAIVDEILSGKIKNDAKNLNYLLSIADENSDKDRNSLFILRGPTGKKAEQLFIEYHRINSFPIAGELIDTRDLGCGYDFEIKSKSNQHFIEVKGLASKRGGLLFTNKEWETANHERSKYTVCIVSNINDSPQLSFINDPFSKLNPRKNIIQTVQIQWSVSNSELQSIND